MSFKLSEDKKYYTLDLKYPVEFGDRVVKTLKIRSRAKTGDLEPMRGPDKATFSDVLEVAANMCDEPLSLLRMVDMEDYDELDEIVARIIEKSKKKRRTRSYR